MHSVLLVLWIFMLIIKATFSQLLVLKPEGDGELPSGFKRNLVLGAREEGGKDTHPPILLGPNKKGKKVKQPRVFITCKKLENTRIRKSLSVLCWSVTWDDCKCF